VDFVSLGESHRDPSPGAIQPAFRLSVQSIAVVVFRQFATGDADLPYPYNIYSPTDSLAPQNGSVTVRDEISALLGSVLV
jgi:hypothetical protein